MRPLSPGMLASHYAPSLPLRLDATSAAPDEALLAFGPGAPAGAAHTLSLSPNGDLVEAAANLFAALRALDRAALPRHRGDADPRAWPRPRHQRPPAPGRGAARVLTLAGRGAGR